MITYRFQHHLNNQQGLKLQKIVRQNFDTIATVEMK
jgi:hypothetical protein